MTTAKREVGLHRNVKTSRVEVKGLEPSTYGLQSRRSSS
jgi:hypothetical protein